MDCAEEIERRSGGRPPMCATRFNKKGAAVRRASRRAHELLSYLNSGSPEGFKSATVPIHVQTPRKLTEPFFVAQPNVSGKVRMFCFVFHSENRVVVRRPTDGVWKMLYLLLLSQPMVSGKGCIFCFCFKSESSVFSPPNRLCSDSARTKYTVLRSDFANIFCAPR